MRTIAKKKDIWVRSVCSKLAPTLRDNSPHATRSDGLQNYVCDLHSIFHHNAPKADINWH